MTKHQAIVVHPGGVTGRPTIELRVLPGGSNEAFLVPSSGTPVATGISLETQNRKYFVRCRKRKKRLAFKPEEVVRQRVLNWVLDDLSYPELRVDVEVPIVMGSAVHPKPADIVVFSDDQCSRAWLVIETKKPQRKDGIEQLKSYMNATGATFGLWTNGLDEKFLLRSKPNDFSKPILRLPRFGENLDDIDEPLTRVQMSPVKDLYSIFQDMEQEILAHQTVDTFEEIFKIVFAKLFDERVNLYNDNAVSKFRLGLTGDPIEAATAVRRLFDQAKKKWKDVYGVGDNVLLNDENVAYCIKALQQYHLIRSGDVLGTAFELLVNQEMKGDMGQFFTPRQVVDMMVTMLNPRLNETLCDPACGSGGFLIYGMKHVFAFIDEKWDDADDRAEQRKDYAQESLIGIDNDARLVRVAKAYMIMENDGRSGIRGIDSLDYEVWPKELREVVLGREVEAAEISTASLIKHRREDDGVDIVLTNPPFAGAIKAPTTLSQYRLSLDSKGTMKSSVVRAILFLERCIDLLRPGGRMGIVLPQGLLNNITDQEIRDFVDEHARVLAVVGIHPYTFKPFTLAKTSVLFLQKWREGEHLQDYPVFTAVSMRPGKTKLGRPHFMDDGVTLNCDMPEIAGAFLSWARSVGLDFVD